jgi:hypothetical protein
MSMISVCVLMGGKEASNWLLAAADQAQAQAQQ